MPTFSIYTFAGEKVGNKMCLVVSKTWTVVNIFLTLVGIVGGIIHGYYHTYNFSYYNNFSYNIVSSLLISIPLSFTSIIMYLILMYGKNCSGKTFLRRSGLDIQKLEVVHPDQDQILEDSIELQPLCKRRPICQCQMNMSQRRNSWP